MIDDMKYRFVLLFLALLLITPTLSHAQSSEGNCFFGFLNCETSGNADIEGVRQDFDNFVRTALDPDPQLSGSGNNRGNNTSADVTEGIGGYIIRIGYFINYVLLPLLFGIALLVFLYNIVRYFINSANVEEREKASRAAIYGIAAFVFLVSIWGIVNLFVSGRGFDQQEALCPDYLGSWCGQGNNNSGTNSNGYVPFSNRVPIGTDNPPAFVDQKTIR